MKNQWLVAAFSILAGLISAVATPGMTVSHSTVQPSDGSVRLVGVLGPGADHDDADKAPSGSAGR